MAKKASKIEQQFQSFVKQLNKAAKSSQKQASSLRSKAADAALHWVTSHEDRVDAFRASVKGTAAERAFDKVMDLVKGESKPAKKKAAAKKAAAKKPAAKKKAPAKKAVKKAAPKKKAPAKKAAKKAAPSAPAE